MIKWKIDKKSKVPFYLQLKDLLKYYISTGTLKDRDQLPGVNSLGEELGVNFETVRKAYKELEKEELISMKRGRGTYVMLNKPSSSQEILDLSIKSNPVGTVKEVIRRLLQTGMTTKDVRATVEKAFQEMEKESSKQVVIFTECNHYQVQEISKLLQKQVSVKIKPVLLQDLEKEVKNTIQEKEKLLAIVTSGFHMSEIREILGNFPVEIYALVTTMSSQIRRKLFSFEKGSKLGVLCRDEESLSFYRDMLQEELGREINLLCSIMKNKSEVENIIQCCDAILATPPVYEEVKERVSSQLPVYNIFDSVDPVSLKIVRETINEMI